MRCPLCKTVLTDGVCPTHGAVSVDADSLDSLVQAASIPNLAALFKRAKDTGIITPAKEYGGAA